MYCINVVVNQIERDWPVLVPGDPELRHMEYCTQMFGIPYHSDLISLMVCIYLVRT